MTKSTPRRVGTHEAKTRLSELLRAVEAGEEVEICRGHQVIARLVAAGDRRTRVLGSDRGVFSVPDNFDQPLPADTVDDFEQ